jgi:hypothetical protein
MLSRINSGEMHNYIVGEILQVQNNFKDYEVRTIEQSKSEFRTFLTSLFFIQMFFIRLFVSLLFKIALHSLEKAFIVFIGIGCE